MSQVSGYTALARPAPAYWGWRVLARAHTLLQSTAPLFVPARDGGVCLLPGGGGVSSAVSAWVCSMLGDDTDAAVSNRHVHAADKSVGCLSHHTQICDGCRWIFLLSNVVSVCGWFRAGDDDASHLVDSCLSAPKALSCLVLSVWLEGCSIPASCTIQPPVIRLPTARRQQYHSSVPSQAGNGELHVRAR